MEILLTVTVKRLMVVPAAGGAILLPDRCIKFQTVGELFILIQSIVRWVIPKTILKAKNLHGVRH